MCVCHLYAPLYPYPSLLVARREPFICPFLSFSLRSTSFSGWYPRSSSMYDTRGSACALWTADAQERYKEKKGIFLMIL